jgi:gliding motility-associated-like protein
MRSLIIVFFSVVSLNLGAQVIDTFPYYDDLETWNLCSEVCSVACNISSGWSNQGNIAFRPDTAGTPTGSTGPSVDHNPGLSSGVYAYVESSAPCNPDTALLESPFIDLTNVQSPGFTFWHHQLTATTIPDTFDVLISTDSGATWSVAYTGPNNTSANTWVYDTIGLSSFIGQVIKLRIMFITANAFNDFAVDDFTFHGIQIIDAGTDSIQSSNGFCQGDSSNICLKLSNFGILPIDSVTIYTTLNGSQLFSAYTFLDTLGPGEDTIVCIGNVLLTTGDVISAYSSMPNGLNDTFNLNDTSFLSVVMNAAPIVNAGPDTTICGLMQYSLGGSPTSATGTLFEWSPGIYLNDSTIANPVGYFTQSGTFSYVVSVTDVNSCSNTDTVDISVFPITPISAGPDTTICNGASTVIGGAPTAPASASVLWSNSSLLDDDTLQNPTATVFASTSFEVVVTDTLGCQFTDTMFVFIFAPPALDPGPDTAVCLGDSVMIGGNPTATNFDSILWSPSGNLSASTFPNPMAAPTIFTTYYIYLVDTFGCSYNDSVDVSIKTPPVANAGNDTTVCAYGQFQMGGSPTGPINATYIWMPGGLFVDSTVANPFITVTQDTMVVVAVTDTITGCTTLDTAFITVFALPFVDAGADTIIICQEDTITLGGSPTTALGNSLSWSPGLDLDDSTSANPILTGDDTYFIFLTVTEPINGCQNFDNVLAIVNLLPIVEAGNNKTICIGDSTTLGGNPTSSLIGTYDWSYGTLLTDSTATNPKAFPTQDSLFFVTVTSTQGCVDYDSVTVFVNPLPTINVTPYTQQCLNDSVQLQVSGGVTYAWSNAVFLNDSAISNPKAGPPGNTSFIVTVTDANSCSDTAVINVDFYPLPVVEAGPNDTICNGGTTGLNATGAISYQWTPSNGLSNPNIANPNASPSVTKEYFVKGTDANSCSFTDSLTIFVNVLPPANAGPDKDVCLNDSIQLGGNPTGPAGASYDWPYNNLNDSLVPNPYFMAIGINPGTYPIQVYVTDGNGCVSIDQVTVTVLTDPTAVISPITTTICVGETLGLSASGGVSFEWSPDSSLTGSNSATPNAFPTQTTQYTVTVTDVNGCASSSSAILNVFPLTPANAGPDVSICQQDTITLNATGGVSYEWSTPLFLSDINVPNPMAYPVSSQTFTVTVTDANGCSEPDDITITVFPLPLTAAGPDVRICEGNSIKIGGTPTGPPGSQYSWSPGGSLNNSSAANPIASPTETKMYFVTVTSSQGCKDSARMKVTVDSLPVIKLVEPLLPICFGDSGVIKVTNNYESYLWTPNSKILSIDQDSAVVYPEVNKTYTVSVVNKRGCKATTSFEVIVLPLPTIEVTDDFDLCEKDSMQLEATGGAIYEWSDGLTLADSMSRITMAYPTTTTDYRVTVTDTNNCHSVAGVRATVFPRPLADAGNDIENCEIDVVTLGGAPTGPSDAVFYWSPQVGLDDPFSPNPVVLNPELTTYRVEVQDRNGCLSIDSVQVNADCFTLIYAPSAFTPGYNNRNDDFKLVHYRVVSPHLEIYNRWGELLFETSDLDIGWDGTEPNSDRVAPTGTYYWVVTYKSETGLKLKKEGTISLLK